MNNLCIIIPAYQPDLFLIEFATKLMSLGFKVIIVNDGSTEEQANEVFSALNKICTVITHPKNMGKGAALKTAMKYILCEVKEKIIGAITVDCDAQHIISDIEIIAQQLKNDTNAFHLGVRNFSFKKTPFRNYIGNRLSSLILYLKKGIFIKDTQTGLRGIPYNLFQNLIDVDGNRFEYETNVLLYLIRKKITIKQHEITCKYNKNNKSHFQPLKDSISIIHSVLSK